MNGQKPLTILIVDDNRANLRILGATFQDNGFTVYEASGVEEAQELLKKNFENTQLVLSDIQMPGLSGFDLLKWMKGQRSLISQIPILLITSQMPTTEDRVLGLSLGATDYLLRSLDPQELVIRVTHAIENYNRIKNLRRNLESTETLASTGRLFAASNHEIKNVSQIIRLAAGILERELHSGAMPISASCEQALKMLTQSSLLLSDVTKMIGGIVGDVPAALGPVELVSLTSQTVTMMRPMLKGAIDLKFDADPNLQITVNGVATFLKQILINLILNARDATDEAKLEGRQSIVIQIDRGTGNLVNLSVRDHGIGFPKKEARHNFEPFSSTKQLRGGTGLGLWLSALLIEKMGGSLILYSEGLNLGATATMTLMGTNHDSSQYR